MEFKFGYPPPQNPGSSPVLPVDSMTALPKISTHKKQWLTLEVSACGLVFATELFRPWDQLNSLDINVIHSMAICLRLSNSNAMNYSTNACH
jgi:hypothetical protein